MKKRELVIGKLTLLLVSDKSKRLLVLLNVFHKKTILKKVENKIVAKVSLGAITLLMHRTVQMQWHSLH
jgi:hypothetical protein